MIPQQSIEVTAFKPYLLALMLVILPPIVLLLEPKHILDLLITQRRLPLTHLPRNGRVRCKFLQNLLRRHCRCNRIIRRIEHLKS
jgi:hypothetical protein